MFCAGSMIALNTTIARNDTSKRPHTHERSSCLHRNTQTAEQDLKVLVKSHENPRATSMNHVAQLSGKKTFVASWRQLVEVAWKWSARPATAKDTKESEVQPGRAESCSCSFPSILSVILLKDLQEVLLKLIVIVTTALLKVDLASGSTMIGKRHCHLPALNTCPKFWGGKGGNLETNRSVLRRFWQSLTEGRNQAGK